MSIDNKGYQLSSMGIINALGKGQEAVWNALMHGDVDRFVEWRHPVGEQRVLVAAVAETLPDIPTKHANHLSRNNQLVLAALEQIEPAVRDLVTQHGADRIGIVLGSSTSGIAEGDYGLEQFDATGAWPATYHLYQQEMGCASSFLADYLELQGPAYTISTACSSSAKAFSSARNLLDAGLCDAVITGGADSLCRMTVSGFSALDAVSETRCNSMSRNRDGLLIGEGAALFIMERGHAPGNVCLLGIGESSDAYHMSAPDPEGAGAITAMKSALNDAGLNPADILYVNLHGTATPHNDAMESKAVEQVFGLDTPCSSTKPMTGHTLGAAGATEAAFCWMMLQHAREHLALPPHCFDGERDPELPPIHLTQIRDTLNWPGTGALLSNSFAFGGNNCSLILGKAG